MMSRTGLILILVGIFSFGSLATLESAEYPRTYKLYMELGKESLDSKKYVEAEKYFKFAQMVAPTSEDPISFLSLIKRLKEGRVESFEGKSADEILGAFQKNPELKKKYSTPEPAKEYLGPKSKATTPTQRTYDAYANTRELESGNKFIEKAVLGEELGYSLDDGNKDAVTEPEKKGDLKATARPSLIANEELLRLDNALWQRQPNTLVNLALQSSLILEGNNIKRFLVITPGVVDVSQVNRGQLKILPVKRGNTFLHVWDDTGRWTFRIEIVLPISTNSLYAKKEKEKDERIRYADPFEFSYATDWGSFYKGDSFHRLERNNLTFIQYLSVIGETPYGDFDSSAVFTKIGKETKISGYTIGLEDGSWRDFENYRIRGFDVNRKFSSLTLPGQFLRGILLESQNLNKNIEWSYIRGKSKESFGIISTGNRDVKDSIIEGVRLVIFPEKDHNYALNFVRGYGVDRKEFLKDRVYSIESTNKWKKWLVESEFAYDEDEMAKTIDTSYRLRGFEFNMNFRDINAEFTNIENRPSNRGEIGGIFELNLNREKYNWSSLIDIYRNRVLPNPTNDKAYNYDFNTSFDYAVTPKTRWASGLFYVDTDGELSSRRSFRVNTNLTQRFEIIENKEISAFIGATFQRNRVNLAPSSDFNRYSLSSGFSMPLIKDSRYFANYEYSWVDEKLSGDELQPNVFNTGVSYNKRFGKDIHTNFSMSYRNEDKTQGLNSFLAGEDSLEGNIGITYQPNEDLELYLDGRLRNVWAEGLDNIAYNEIDVRSGARTNWELPFRWNPQGIIKGVVFKDLNGNEIFEKGEEGIPNAKIQIGTREYLTDEAGLYYVKVRAKRVNVGLDTGSLPDGQVLTTPSVKVVEIESRKMNMVNFGVSTNSGIYGVVYYDKNEDGRPDVGDEFIRNVEIVLDGSKSALSGFEGDYFFKKIEPGIHTLTFKIGTIPIQYLPAIKMKNTVEVSEGTTYVFHIPLKKR